MGGMRHRWTSGELRFIRDNAGAVPPEQMAAELGVSLDALFSCAKRMRRDGAPLDLRCWRSELERCELCGNMCATCDAGGTCRACRLRERARALRAEIAALQGITPGEVPEIERTRTHPKPPKPARIEGRAYQVAMSRDRLAREREAIRIREAQADVKALQKRKERAVKVFSKSYDK